MDYDENATNIGMETSIDEISVSTDIDITAKENNDIGPVDNGSIIDDGSRSIENDVHNGE